MLSIAYSAELPDKIGYFVNRMQKRSKQKDKRNATDKHRKFRISLDHCLLWKHLFFNNRENKQKWNDADLQQKLSSQVKIDIKH